MTRPLILLILLTAALFPCQAQKEHALAILDKALAYVYKPGEYAADLDSALLLVRQAETTNSTTLKDRHIEAKACFVYSNALREKGDKKTGRKYIERSLALYTTLSFPSELGDAWLEASSYYSSDTKKDIVKKKECFEKALPLFIATGDKAKQAGVLKELGDFYQILNDPVQAMTCLKKSLALYQSIGYRRLNGVYDLMGVISTVTGDYPNAVKYGLLAVKTAEEVNDTSMQLCTIYNRLGMAYNNWSKTDEAQTFFKKAMTIAIKYRDMDAIEVVMENLTNLLCRQGNWKEPLVFIRNTEALLKDPPRPPNEWDTAYLAMCYTSAYTTAKQYDRAKPYAATLIDILKRDPEVSQWLSQAYLSLFVYSMATHQYAAAKKHVSDLLSTAILESDKGSIATDYLLRSRVDSALGDFRTALTDYQMYKNMSDSMLNKTTSFQFAQMQVEYQTEKKDNDIKLLRQQEELQRSRLTQVRTSRNLVIAGIVVLALLLGLVYSRYRIKKRSIEEKEGLIKEIHHRVKNNLQIVISLLNVQSEFLDNPSALAAIQESRERMHAIAIIHQKLYQVDNSTLINIQSYIYELIDNLKKSFDNSGRIYFQLDIADICLDVSQSVPLSLILNEAITNAIKYAFFPHEQGTIIVALDMIDHRQVQLKIKDNGKGLPPGMDIKNNHSLGFQLMHLFTEQLEGTLDLLNEGGLTITLSFPSM